MESRTIGPIFLIFLFSFVQPAAASVSYIHTTWILTNQDEVRANVGAWSALSDEIDRLDVSVLLYQNGIIFDIELGYGEDSCLRVGTETLECGAGASYSPLSAGCEYCSDAQIVTYRNQELNPSNPPSWQQIENIHSNDNCDTAPSGGGGPGGGGGEIP